MKTTGVVRFQKAAIYKKDLARSFRKNPTESEKVLWGALRRHQVLNLHFRRQQIIEGYVADFYCEKIRLAVEADGGIHRQSEQILYDKERAKAFSRKKIEVLRFPNELILGSLYAVIDEIKKFAAGRGIDSSGVMNSI